MGNVRMFPSEFCVTCPPKMLNLKATTETRKIIRSEKKNIENRRLGPRRMFYVNSTLHNRFGI